MSEELPERRPAHGPPLIRALMRSCPEDFQVDELSGFEPSGEGEHLMLDVRKRGLNTAFVAGELARWAGVAEHAVGYAGLKDRHALTTQRFTVHLPKRVAPDMQALQVEGMEVLQSRWHARKLPRGALAGNRFTLTLRAVEGDAEALGRRLEAIAAAGLPNYFGAQRFGHGGGNLDAARALFAGRRFNRNQRSILISAARSTVFNAVLAKRVESGSWARGLDGELWMLDGRQSIFGPQAMDDALRARAASLDIHPTGPMWGRGAPPCGEPVASIERAVADRYRELCDGLESAGLRQERRALRIRVGGLAWHWSDARTLVLEFDLPPGAYATGLLEALGDVVDASSGPRAG